MKNWLFPVVFLVAVGMSGLSLAASKALRKGTAVLHFSVRQTLTPAEDSPTAFGRVEAKLNQQGKADNQRLDILAGGLAPDAPYQVRVRLADQTEPTQVATLQTDANGLAVVRWTKTGASQGRGSRSNKQGLPAGLDPISQIREVWITDGAGQAVLGGSLTASERLHYLVKRNLTNDGVDPDAAGQIHLQGNGTRSQFRLVAAGLEPATEYALALNGEVAQSHLTDQAGWLNIRTWLTNPADVLEVRRLAVWDQAGASVLSTTLP